MALQTILVPTDFRESSTGSVSYAFQLARKLGAKAHLLHAYDASVTAEESGYANLTGDALARAVAERMREVAAPYEREPFYGEPIVVTGDPIRAILAAATRLQVDLIVLGSHARVGLERMLLGSVAERVMRESLCPALVVKSGKWEP